MNKQTVFHLQKLRKMAEEIESISLDIHHTEQSMKNCRKILERKSLIRSNHAMNPTNAHNALGYLWKRAMEKAKPSVGGRRRFCFCCMLHPRLLASF